MWEYFNPNPDGKNVGDCTVRAIAKATDRKWMDVYISLAMLGAEMHDMPSSNAVWGEYLRRNGFKRMVVPNECPTCYTLEDFAVDNNIGTFIVALSGHVVCVCDGIIFDSYDSGRETPIYYWKG